MTPNGSQMMFAINRNSVSPALLLPVSSACDTTSRPKGQRLSKPISQQARAHGKPMIEIVISAAANHHISANAHPPSMNHRKFAPVRMMKSPHIYKTR